MILSVYPAEVNVEQAHEDDGISSHDAGVNSNRGDWVGTAERRFHQMGHFGICTFGVREDVNVET